MSLSEWHLVHKGSVCFGPRLWLMGHLEKQLECVTFAKQPECVTFDPPMLAAAALPPPPSPAHASLLPPAPVSKPLTNEELLKSIGFLPSGSSHDTEAAPFITIVDSDDGKSHDAEDAITIVDNGSSRDAEGASFFTIVNDDSGSCTASIAGSTSKLLDTFEVIEKPEVTSAHPAVKQDLIETMDSGDFVMIVPDCFDLDKPLSSFTPPESLSHVPEPSQSDLALLSLAALSLSHEDHVTYKSPAADVSSGTEAILIPPADKTEPQASDGDKSGSTSPSTVRKNAALAPNRLTMRKLRGGLYRNPLAVATGLVNAMSGFVDDKVHFTSPATKDKNDEESSPPKMSELESCSDSSDEEFEASVQQYIHLRNSWLQK